jgi:hypothetical protein
MLSPVVNGLLRFRPLRPHGHLALPLRNHEQVKQILVALRLPLLPLVLLHVLEHLIKHKGQELIIGGQELHQLLLLNLRELFDLILGAGLHGIDVDVEKTIIEDVAHRGLLLASGASTTGVAMAHCKELMPQRFPLLVHAVQEVVREVVIFTRWKNDLLSLELSGGRLVLVQLLLDAEEFLVEALLELGEV